MDVVQQMNPGLVKSISEKLTNTYSPDFLKWLSPTITYNPTYNWKLNIFDEIQAADVKSSATFKTQIGFNIQDFIELPGTVDSVFANAGIGNPDKLSSGRSDAMNQILRTNILGVTNVVMPFIPYLKEQKSGKIAVISSVASFRGLAHHSAYSGSKAAVRNISQGWGVALHKYGISVTAVCPGFIKSEMTANNDFPMPFLMDTNIAAEKIIRAVNRKKKVFIFPWQWKVFMVPIMKYAPDWIVRRLGM